MVGESSPVTCVVESLKDAQNYRKYTLLKFDMETEMAR
jgi:hypothetical protein